jgi:O-succinylbenzoate synthase
MTPLPIPRLLGIEVIGVAVPLRRPYVTGTTRIKLRESLLLQMIGEHGVGWGECAPVPGYSPESLAECRSWLTTAATSLLDGTAPPQGPATARAALDAGLHDLAAQADDMPLWRSLGGVRDQIPVGGVLGLDQSPTDAVASAEQLAETGYRRIKLKVERDRGFDAIAAVRKALPHHDLAVDANGTFDAGHLAAVVALDDLGLSFIEQPFAADDLEAHAALAAAVATPVCLDESIVDLSSAERAVEAGAAGVINIKPARVGGLREAVAIHDLAVAAGIPVWCGGMIESGFGKASALAVASLPGMVLPADLPPSDRHFASDLVASPWTMTDGLISLSEAPGAGIEPDWDQIDAFTTSVTRFGDDVGLRR